MLTEYGRDSSFAAAVVAARAGEQWGWHHLLSGVAPRLLAYLRAQGAADPEGLLGQVVDQLVLILDHFDGDEARFRSWLFVVAHGRVEDERRCAAHTRAVLGERQLPAHAGASVESPWPWAPYLDELPEDQRAVLLLRVVAGLSVAETAFVIGRTAEVVRDLHSAAEASLEGLAAKPAAGL